MRIREHNEELSVEADFKDHETAGFVYDERESIREMNMSGEQCVIMRRGGVMVKFCRSKSVPPRLHEGPPQDRETATSLTEDRGTVQE